MNATTIELVALACAVACLVTFSWARRFYFHKNERTSPLRFGLRPLGTIFGVGAIASLVLDVEARARGSAYGGIALFCLSLMLFIWTAFYLKESPPSIAFTPDPPKRIAIFGPFRVARHPFYLSYILFWTGLLVSSPSIYAAIAEGIMLALYIKAARTEERLILDSDQRKIYAEYRRRVGMFWPVGFNLLQNQAKQPEGQTKNQA